MILERFRLDNKVALITGGSRGIGKAMALAFAEAGADVVISSRKLPELEESAKEICAFGKRCLPIAAHAGKNEELDRLVSKTMTEFGRIDILVCNAATNPQPSDVIDTEEWAWDAVMNLNLKGYFLLSQKVAKIMIKQGRGSIIFTGSTNAFKPNRSIGVYSVSKAGEHLLAEILAYELGKYKVRVNVLAPGATRTQMSGLPLENYDSQDTEVAKSMIARTALGRLAEPQDMQGAALFLASDASNHVTGQIIVVDGGAVTWSY